MTAKKYTLPPLPFYCVVDAGGKKVWAGKSSGDCADRWCPGTYWGGGNSPQEAYEKAVARLPQRRAFTRA